MPPFALRPRLPSPLLLARIAIGAAALLLGAWAQLPGPPGVSRLGDEWLRDRFVRLQESTAPEPRVLVVDIDEPSMAELGPWPWPRARLADLVEKLLTTYKARGVALDIMLPAPGADNGDQRLAMLAQHAPLVLAQAFEYNSVGARLRDGQLGGGLRPPDSRGVPASGYIGNHAALAAHAAHVGNIGFVPDADGVLRRVPLYTRFENRLYLPLSAELVNCCAGGPPLALPSDNFMRVSFKRDWKAYDVVPAARLLDPDLGEAPDIEGRLVLIGSSALGQADRVATPLAAQRPGLGVQAAMLSTLLDYQAAQAPAPWPGRLIAILYAAAVALLAMLAFGRLSALAALGLLAAAALGWLALARPLSFHDPDVVTTGPLATCLFLLAVAVPFQWQVTQQRSRRLLGALRQYVARAVVDEMLRRGLKDPLKPAQREVTTLIADMEGYTTQVEALPVEEAASLTREFLECLTNPVLERGGTLDKYTGDGLVAFWGAPLPVPEHADLALDAAGEIVRRVRALSTARVAAGKLPLRVRIGIDSGLAMAGDFGTATRSIYTAVGDSVNTASRLEQAARDFPYDVIIGDGTVARASRHRFLSLGQRRLRGKEKETRLYTLDDAGVAGAPPPAVMEMATTAATANTTAGAACGSPS
jgi:adenylate cyclase